MQLDPETHQMTAIVLAGDRTKADSLVNHSEAGAKAMIDIDGLPMVRRVLNALRASRVVDKICLAGPEASAETSVPSNDIATSVTGEYPLLTSLLDAGAARSRITIFPRVVPTAKSSQFCVTCIETTPSAKIHDSSIC